MFSILIDRISDVSNEGASLKGTPERKLVCYHGYRLQESIKRKFISDWESTKLKQRKMEFYNTVKPAFGEEIYLASANFLTRRGTS